MNNIIIDTNCYNVFINGDKRVIKSYLSSPTIYISVITVGELYSGFYKGSKLDENRGDLKKFLNNQKVKICYITEKTSEIYGRILSDLLKKGIPIPTNDVWIAACAIETDSTLVTYDKHFLKVPGLRVWDRLSN